MKIVNPFLNVSPPVNTFQDTTQRYGKTYLSNLAELQVGHGSKVMRSDLQGIWLGAEKFEDAPFAVDMEGNMRAVKAFLTGYPSTSDLNGYVSKTGTGQNLTGNVNVGNGNVLIDGVNARILISDSTNPRGLFGYQAGGF